MIIPFLADAANAIRFQDLGLSPVALDLGPLQIRWYSLGYIAGILIGWWYLLKLIAQPGAPMARRHADDMVFYATIGILVGGRLGYVLFYQPSIWAHPIDVLKLWQGGMSFHGGVIGTTLAILWLARKNGLNWLRIHDYVACCAPFGLFFVRIANFVNGELWGRPTDVPWAVIFPRAGPEPRHPSQLYEAGAEGILLFALLWFLFWRTDARYQPGKLVGAFILGYGLIRTSLETVRQPDFGLEHLPWGLTMGQTLSVPMIAGGLYLILTAKGRRERVEPIAGGESVALRPAAAADCAGFADRLLRMIETGGPIPIAQYMALANSHYYATRDPLGRSGDFVTAPEISQMFGELIGLWAAELWLRAGAPQPLRYVELGPGRGTLAADALRALASAGMAADVHFVETSPVLRAAQAERVPGASWHDDAATLPGDGPLLIVANEFFDALPIRQFERTARGWRERMVDAEDGRLVLTTSATPADAAIPAPFADAPLGSVIEASPASVAILRMLGGRIAAQGGALLAIDYGYPHAAPGDTLQAVTAHRFSPPLARPGEQDLTAHVDFGALGEAARGCGLAVHGPADQGSWLEALGIGARAGRLAAAQPHRAEEIEGARRRLTHAEAMGTLFKVFAATAPGWPAPAGFA